MPVREQVELILQRFTAEDAVALATD
jgi:hypothetical protein